MIWADWISAMEELNKYRYFCVKMHKLWFTLFNHRFSINFKFLSWNFIYLNIDLRKLIISFFVNFCWKKRLINSIFIQLELNVSKFRKNKLKTGTWKKCIFPIKNPSFSDLYFYFSHGINKCFNGGIIIHHLLAIEKNGDSDDQGDQRNAITGEIYSRRDNLCTALDRWLAKISTEAIVAIVAPDTVCSAPTARVLWK